ncbi:MAG: hypothetical protein HYZ42_18520 [Bacteroidetes bacterium]|nr:hypothetical protein [Bacteroidota bacterium]
MMKKLYVSILAIGIFASCNNTQKAEEKSESPSEAKTETSQTTPEVKEPAPAPEEVKKELSIDDLAGHWEQTESAEGNGMSVSAKLTVDLKADGTFKSSQSTMGVKSSQNGKWSLDGKTVNLSGLEKLEYDESTQTLVNQKEHISLQKK